MKAGVTTCADTLDPLREGRAANEISDKLVFYEVSGRDLQTPPTASSLGDLNRLVEKGVTKSIERSTGGFTLATAGRILVEESSGLEPAVRVRMQFKDFVRNALGKVEKAQYVLQYKTLFPEEIRDAVPFAIGGDQIQRYLLDFGDGAIPVQVVHLAVNAKNEGLVYFIELTDLDNVRNGKKNTQVWVRVHCCDAAVLRFLPEYSRESGTTFQNALATYSRLRKEGRRIIPQCFEFAPPFRAPAGLAISDLRNYLELMIKRHQSGATEAKPKANSFEIVADDLVPFGTFE